MAYLPTFSNVEMHNITNKYVYLNTLVVAFLPIHSSKNIQQNKGPQAKTQNAQMHFLQEGSSTVLVVAVKVSNCSLKPNV